MRQYNIMEIDKIPNQVWLHVLHHPNDFTWNFFALKIILMRLSLKMSMFGNDPGKEVIGECCDELRDLMKKSMNVPNAQKDMELIASLADGELAEVEF